MDFAEERRLGERLSRGTQLRISADTLIGVVELLNEPGTCGFNIDFNKKAIVVRHVDGSYSDLIPIDDLAHRFTDIKSYLVKCLMEAADTIGSEYANL